ncbi:MAG: HAMP domain-containing sensor histidine kinase [Dehalococcoidia bacterium]|nr:HAMP domain-containing sensor histidine kinase [Dehalococcoidia bacterium]
MSIRWRLALSFALLLAIPAMAASLFFYVAFRNWVIAERIDGDLKAYATLAAVPLVTENADYDLTASVWNSFPDKSVQIQLVDSDRNVVLKSENLGDQVLPVDNNLVDNGFKGFSGIATVSSDGDDDIRVRAVPILIGAQIHVMEVGKSLSAVDPILSRMGVTLALVVLVFLTLAGISAMVLVSRALSPVKKVTAIAQSISSSSDLSRRVNYRGPKDEIGQLAATFDQMIDRIDSLVRSQRSFVADASHELRGPLTVIQGNLGLLKRDISEEDRQESLRAMDAEAARMTRVINDLLVLAELESGQVGEQQMVSLKDLVLDAQDRALLIAGQRRIILGRVDDLWVKGDAYRLDQMLSNLVSNAIKYTPDGGTITLSVFQDGDWACLEVSDTGIGIAPEHLPHLFDRFYRVDKARSRAAGGTGLGLAIVKGIAEQHGGRVTVTSEPGKGTTFIVWLKL